MDENAARKAYKEYCAACKVAQTDPGPFHIFFEVLKGERSAEDVYHGLRYPLFDAARRQSYRR